MSYTPPAGGSISVDIGTPTYTPPAGASIAVDLSVDEDISGQYDNVGLGTVTVQAHIPAFSASNSLPSPISVVIVGELPASYFQGRTDILSSAGGVVVAGGAPTEHRARAEAVPTATLSLSGPTPSFVITEPIDIIGSVVIAGAVGVTQKLRIRRGVLSKYSYPTITLEVYGSVVVSAPAGITQTLRIRTSIVSPYTIRLLVSAYVDSPYRFKVSKQVSSLYSIRGSVAAQVGSVYSVLLLDRVSAYVAAPYGMPVSAYHVSSYSLPPGIPVGVGIASIYSLVSPLYVKNSVVSTYSYYTRVRKAVTAYFNLTSEVKKATTVLYTLSVSSIVRKGVVSVYTSRNDNTQVVVGAPFATVSGSVIPIESAEVSIAEGEFLWKGSIVLTHIGDYIAFTRDTPFTITIGTEVFHFIMDTKELSRSNPANISAVIYGVSPSAVYDEPRSDILNQSWDAPVLASVAAQSVIPGISWGVLDWVIPAYRLAASSVSPYALVSVIAQAIGATVETDLAGGVYVRSLYPVSVPNFPTTVPDHTITDADDIFTSSESYPSDRVYNRIIVSDVEDSIADSLEWVPAYDGAFVGAIKSYLRPWRSGTWLTHTGRPNTYINTPSVVLVEYSEVLEIFEGKGSATHPIYNVVSVEYEANNVGALMTDSDSPDITVVAANPNTVIRLVYQSRSLDYPVGMVDGAPTQFLLHSPPL